MTRRTFTAWLLILLPVWAMAAPAHFVLLRYVGPEPEKYRASLVALVSGDNIGLRSLVSTLPDDATNDDVIKEARRFACDVVLSVTIAPGDDGDKITWSLWSPDEKRPRATGTVTKPKPTWPMAADIYWVFLADPLTKETGPNARPWPQPPVAEQASFTVHAQPGTRVSGLPSGPAIVDKTGNLTVVLNLPVSVSLEGHLELWITKPTRVFVDHPDQEVTLDQILAPQWSVDAAMNNLTFPSVGVEWRPWSRLIARFMIDQYFGGLLFTSRDSGSNGWPVQSLPLMTLQLGAAWDWSWPEESIQFYSGLDVGLRVMFPQYEVVAIEPLAPITIEPLVGWEYHWTAGQAIYFEGGPALSWVFHQTEYEASIPQHSQDANFQIPGTPFYMALPLQAKVGYRWFF
jgi:hypothetical protein